MKKLLIRRAVLVIGASMLVATVSSAASTALASVSSHKTKKLSLATVNLGGGPTATEYACMWVAKDKGFFKQQGLTVNIENFSGLTAADHIAAIISNSDQFEVAGAPATALAIQAGAPLRTIFVQDYSGNDELAINSSFATAHNIPATGTPLTQLNALKGTHITIGYGNASSGTYVDLLTVLEQHGFTVGPNGDVNLIGLGSATTQVAALNSGKVNAIANTPPFTVQPNSIEIKFGAVAPVNRGYMTNLLTNETMIKQHPDTVQAFMNALVKAWAFTRTNPAATQAIAVRNLELDGITSPEEALYLYAIDRDNRGATPAPSRVGALAVKTEIDTAALFPNVAVPLTIPPSAWTEPKFADKAIKSLGLKGVPLS